MTPSTGRQIMVHKEGEEGALQVDALTGYITTPVDARPDWSDGLAVALLQERATFYERRLGPAFSPAMRDATAIAFQDLGWVGVDEEQEACELSADHEYRADVVAKVLGINREDFEADADHFGPTVAEVEIDLQDRAVSKAEATDIDTELLTGFATRHPETARKASGE